MTQKTRGRKRRGRPPKRANAIQKLDQSLHSHERPTAWTGEFGTHPPDASNSSTSRPREERSYKDFFPDLNVKEVLSISVVDEEPGNTGNYEEPTTTVMNGGEESAAVERSISPAPSVRSSNSSGESNADSENNRNSKGLKRKRDEDSSSELNGRAKRQTLYSDDFDAGSSELSSASNIDEDALQETSSDEPETERDPLLTHQKEGDIFQALSTRPQHHVSSAVIPGEQKLGVNVDILPKPSFRKVVQNDTEATITEINEDGDMSTSDHPGRYKRPHHYIRYIEPSEVDLMETIEYDMDEQDEAWLQMLNEQRQKENLGEVSADLFEAIMDQLEKEWFDLIKNLPKQVDEEPLLPEDSACAICDDTECENSNAIVFCDGCNLAVHQDCYGVPYIPEGQWLCRKCMVSPENPVSCLFCPNEGGAFKQTNTNKWGHLLCAIWIPEVGLSNSVYMEPIDNIENVPKSRWKLTCYICRRRQGACIQCDNKNCFVAFHVTCARWARLCMRMKSHSSHFDGVVFKAYCDRHTPRDYREQINVEQNVRAAQAFFESSRRDKSGGQRVPRQRYIDTELAQERLLEEDNKKVGRKKQSRSNLKANAVAQLLPSSKAARAHQHQYSAGAPIVPNYIISKIEELRCIKQASHLRQKKQIITSICRYWSLKRESRRGAPLLKRLHLEPWTASSSQHKQSEVEKALRAAAMMNLRADLERVRLLSEQVQKREKQKLERMRKQKAYLELILFPVEYIMRPVIEQLMELDKKELFRYPVTADVAPDYADIIDKPMSFADILEKLASHVYTSIDQIQDDLMLIWRNSMTYNKPETIYYRLAEKLEKQTNELVAKARKDYEELEIKKETGILATEVHPEIFTYNTVHIPSPEELAAERERIAAEERAKAEEEEKKRIAEAKAEARREAAAAKRQAKAAAAEQKRQKSRERAAALRAKKAEELSTKNAAAEAENTTSRKQKTDMKEDNIAEKRRRTRSMGSEGLIAPTPQELENRKSSEARRLVWYTDSDTALPVPSDTQGKRKERGWLYLDDDSESQPPKRSRNENARDSKKAKKQGEPVNIKHKQIVWARIRGFPPHPARIIDPNKQKVDPNVLASKHASTPVLVEFFQVPEKHQWGWISSTNLYPFGDPERDKEMLILARKTRNANRIRESQNGYRHACELLGLDPEPALTAFKN